MADGGDKLDERVSARGAGGAFTPRRRLGRLIQHDVRKDADSQHAVEQGIEWAEVDTIRIP